jgi:hypothetical protein
MTLGLLVWTLGLPCWSATVLGRSRVGGRPLPREQISDRLNYADLLEDVQVAALMNVRLREKEDGHLQMSKQNKTTY